MLERPFHFIVVVWGAHFTRSFLEFCIPSLLAPGNLPSLQTRVRSKILIATEPADWARMNAAPIFRELEKYVDPVYIEMPPQPANKSGCEHMGIGHHAACKIAHDEKAYALVLTPDSMVSDGTIAKLQEHAQNGVELVWVAALRFGEEPFLGHLKALGVLPDESRSETGKPLIISGRQMVFAAVNGMHSETMAYEWAAPYFVEVPSAVWWRVPGENGIVVHSLSWAPLLMDFGSVDAHDTTALEQWTIDGDYVFRNLGHAPKMHVVQDSDEMFLSSWGPLSDRAFDLKPRFTSRSVYLNNLKKGRGLRLAINSSIFDPLKRRCFFLPVRWHAEPLNAKWQKVERDSSRILRLHVGNVGLKGNGRPAINMDRVRAPAGSVDVSTVTRVVEVFTRVADSLILTCVRGINRVGQFIVAAPARIWKFCARIGAVAKYFWRNRLRISGHIKKAVTGDRGAWALVFKRVGQYVIVILGHHRNPERPQKTPEPPKKRTAPAPLIEVNEVSGVNGSRITPSMPIATAGMQEAIRNHR